jgi:hypothetical protein
VRRRALTVLAFLCLVTVAAGCAATPESSTSPSASPQSWTKVGSVVLKDGTLVAGIGPVDLHTGVLRITAAVDGSPRQDQILSVSLSRGDLSPTPTTGSTDPPSPLPGLVWRVTSSGTYSGPLVTAAGRWTLVVAKGPGYTARVTAFERR